MNIVEYYEVFDTCYASKEVALKALEGNEHKEKLKVIYVAYEEGTELPDTFVNYDHSILHAPSRVILEEWIQEEIEALASFE